MTADVDPVAAGRSEGAGRHVDGVDEDQTEYRLDHLPAADTVVPGRATCQPLPAGRHS